MFWRGRKRKESASKEALKPDTVPQNDTPEPATTSNDESDTGLEPIANEKDEESVKERQKQQAEETTVEESSPSAPEAAVVDLASPQERLERKRQEALQEQKVLEIQALARDSFCKNQRVRYLHKASGKHFEAVILAVHFDDGVDRPYYTIRYARDDETIEKQTTSDRLSYVAFDEDKTYEIISSKIKV